MEEKETEDVSQGEQDPRKNFWTGRPLISIGLMIFTVFCACILVFFLLFRYHGFATGWSKLVTVLQPIIFGAIIAYLVNPVMMFLERHILHYFAPRVKNQDKLKKTARTLGTTGGLLFLVLVIVGLFSMVVPQLISSITGAINTVPKQVQEFTKWLDHAAANSDAVEAFSQNLLSLTDRFQTWLESEVMPQASTYISSITSGVISFVKSFLNAIIGLIVASYILFSKEKFVGEFKKITYALFSADWGNRIIKTVRKTNEIFGGFIIGKIIDSAIIGVISVVILSIMKMPYALLVSVIIGVTNIIPFFGPFIGAIPSFILIVLADPLKGIYFLIFVLILQQVDGNIIGPKILGNSTGLSSFWVIFAILVGGGFFGFPGMVLGVPAFAVLYYLIQKFLAGRLKKKLLPQDTEAYIKVEHIDKVSQQLIYPEENKQN